MADVSKPLAESELLAAGYRWIVGTCHCQYIEFRTLLSRTLTITLCNCGICYKSGHQELLVHQDRFQLSSGHQFLKEYRFGDKRADHTFCVVCGIMPFYRPKSNPDCYSVNARCVDIGFAETVEYVEFDGQNWQASIDAGSHRATQ